MLNVVYCLYCLSSQVCESVKKKFGVNIASIACDNAAVPVGREVTTKLPEKPQLGRDCAHSADLMSKDCAKLPVVKKVLDRSKLVFDFMRTDIVDGMRVEAIEAGTLGEIHCVQNYAETRMNNVDEHVLSCCQQFEFLTQVVRNMDSWKEHYKRRTNEQKKKINDFFRNVCNQEFWEQMEKLLELTGIYRRLNKIIVRTDVPASAMPLLVQATLNEILAVLTDDSFDEVLGAGSAKEVLDCIEGRFNMDGEKPPGRKVGMLDRHHLWAFICDPYQHDWRRTFVIPGGLQMHVLNMIEYYIPLDEDGGSKARDDMEKQILVRGMTFLFIVFSWSSAHILFYFTLHTHTRNFISGRGSGSISPKRPSHL